MRRITKSPVAASAIIDALTASPEGQLPDEHDPTLAAFSEYSFPPVDEEEIEILERFVADHHDHIVQCLFSENSGLRHLAAFALGFSRDTQSVEPLISLLVDQKDRYDHDYCYDSLSRLAELALEPLYRIALEDDGERAFQAVQGLGQSAGDPLPWLHRLLHAKELPRGFFAAYENTHNPAGLPDVEVGLGHADPETRHDALFATWTLLEVAWEGSHEVLSQIDREKWGDRMVALLNDDDVKESEIALYCLGLLGDLRYLNVVTEYLKRDDEHLVDCALTALGYFRCETTRKMLADLLDNDKRVTAWRAAIQLYKDPDTLTDIAARARKVVLRGLLEAEGYILSCLDAGRSLASTAIGRRELYACIESAEEPARSKAVSALLFCADRLPEGALDEWLTECRPIVAQRLRAAVDEKERASQRRAMTARGKPAPRRFPLTNGHFPNNHEEEPSQPGPAADNHRASRATRRRCPRFSASDSRDRVRPVLHLGRIQSLRFPLRGLQRGVFPADPTGLRRRCLGHRKWESRRDLRAD